MADPNRAAGPVMFFFLEEAKETSIAFSSNACESFEIV